MNEEEKEVIEDMGPEGDFPGEEQAQASAAALGDMIREYVRRGNVAKILIKRGEDILVNLPLTAGIVGGIISAVAAPWALITAAIATAGFDCTVELVKEDGEIKALNLRQLGKKVVDAGATVVDEIRDAVDGIKAGVTREAEEAAPEAPEADEEIPFAEVTQDEE